MKKFRLRRSYVVAYTVIFSLAILFSLSQNYDDFSRNPTVDETNKALIERYLSVEDRRMLIDENIPTERFIQFIRSPGFTLANFEYYEAIANNSDLSNDDVVTYGNELVADQFTLSSIRNILGNRIYTVKQLLALANFIETNPDISVEFFPNDLLALSNYNHYIGSYTPNDLVDINPDFTINQSRKRLVGDANDGLNQMCAAMKLLNDEDCGGLIVEYAYISYNNVKNHPDRYPDFLKPGQNDFQLGRSVMFKDDNTKSNPMYVWMLDNAHNFGFIQRFPLSQVELTQVNDHPLVFRYVGVDIATNMFNANQVVEQMR